VRAGVELLAVAVVPGLLDVVAVLDLDGRESQFSFSRGT